MSSIEQTLSIIKPDAVERNLDNEIKQLFIKNGFNIFKEKKIQIEKSEAEKFYKVHETKPFYNDLCTYLSSGGPIVQPDVFSIVSYSVFFLKYHYNNWTRR